MKNMKVVMGVLIVVSLGLGFFGGMKYQEQSKTNVNATGLNRLNGQNSQRTGRQFGNGGRPVMGEVISVDDKSITVKLDDGSSKIVLTSDKTQYTKSSEGKREDMVKGERVLVNGTDNSDGSVTAQFVSLNPGMGMRNRPTGSPNTIGN
jgi:hypothetical protein